MNPMDQAAINQMLNASGIPSAFGTPGYGPSFGNLPQMYAMQPGSSFLSNGSFFQPQLYSPYHFSIGNSPLGGLLGYGMEMVAANNGYQYFPAGVNVADVLRGRNLEQNLRQAMSIGFSSDQNRLAGVIHNLTGLSGGVSRATAESAMMPLWMSGMAGMTLPGGSAIDFARNMYMATQNVRDYTSDRYSLGMQSRDALSMTNRMLDYFAPSGMPSMELTRGLKLGDIGSLASRLTSSGLLDVRPISDAGAREYSRGVFGDVKIEEAELPGLRRTAQTSNIGKQLKSYSEVIATMREIVGSPDAPVDQLIAEIQKFTGGAFQEFSASTLQNTLIKVKEMAKASNISMEMMMEISKSGANMARQMGMRGDIGSTIAQQASMSTVVSQTAFPGAYIGRLSPDEESNLRFQTLARNVMSPAMRMSAQTQMLLSNVDLASLSGDQRNTYNELMAAGKNAEITPARMAEVKQKLASLGIGENRAMSALMSDTGVQQFISQNPNMISAIQRASSGEAIARLGQVSRGVLSSIMADPNDTIGSALRNTGMSAEDVSGLVARSFSEANTPGGRAEWLQNNGLNLNTNQLNSLLQTVDTNQGVSRVFNSANVKDAAGFMQLFSSGRQKAIDEQQKNVAIGVEGQTILSGLNLKTRGDVISRIMGSIGRGNTTLQSVMSGAGFVMTADVEKAFGTGGIERISNLMNLLNTTSDPALHAEYQEQLGNAVEAVGKIASQMPNIGGMSATGEMINKMYQGDMFKDIATMRDIPGTDTGIEAAGRIAGRLTSMSQHDIDMATKPLGKSGEIINVAMSEARETAEKFRTLQAKFNMASTPEERESIRKEFNELPYKTQFSNLEFITKRARSSYMTAIRAGKEYSYKSAAEAFNAIEMKKREFANAQTPEEKKAKLIELKDLIAQNTELLYEKGPGGVFTPRKELLKDIAHGQMLAGVSTDEILSQNSAIQKSLLNQRDDIGAVMISNEDIAEQVDDAQKSISTNALLNTDALTNPYSFTDEEKLNIRNGTVPGGLSANDPRLRAQQVRNTMTRLQAVLSKSRKDAPTAELINSLKAIIQNDKGGVFKNNRVDPDALKLFMATEGDGSLDGASDLKALFDTMAKVGTDLKDFDYSKILEETTDKLKDADAKKAESDKAKEQASQQKVEFVDGDTGEKLSGSVIIKVMSGKSDGGKAAATSATRNYNDNTVPPV